MKNGMIRGFTLIELMLVMAIMGLLGTLSVGGYRAMRRGMEERGVVDNVNQFINNAYERARIDGQPTVVYFWNETRKGESDDDGALVAVGRAVAVRRAGRISFKNSEYLVDEFGDLRFYVGTDENGKEGDDSKKAEKLANDSGTTMALYRMKPGGSLTENRFLVATTTAPVPRKISLMLTDPDWNPSDDKVKAYGYRIRAGSIGNWKVGEAYGTEFADMTLPNNYIFGTSFKTTTTDPVAEVNTVIWFYPPSSDSTGGGEKTVGISAIRPGSSGAPEAKSIGQTKNPEND